MCTDYLYLWIGIRVQRLQCRIEQTEVNFHSVHRLFLFSKKNEKSNFSKMRNLFLICKVRESKGDKERELKMEKERQ